MTMRTTNRVVSLSLLAALVLAGCSRGKELEQQNREQARVIADLNQQVSNLQNELSQMKGSQGAARVGGGVTAGGSQRSYIK